MMDTPERLDDQLPARRPSAPPPAASAEPPDDYGDSLPPPPGGSRGITPRLVLRALRRHWVIASLLWLVVSSGLIAAAYYRVKPTYDAISRIKVDQTSEGIFVNNPNGQTNVSEYMETQVSNVSSPKVVQQALQAHPELTRHPLLRESTAPVDDIRHAIRVGVVPKTTLIQVEMSSQSPDEAKDIVNAVVEAFLKLAADQFNNSSEKQIGRLKDLKEQQLKEVERQRKLIEDQNRKLGAADVEQFRDRNVTSIETFRQHSNELTSVEIMIIATKAKLDLLRDEKALPARPQDEAEIKRAVTDAFYADMRVSSLQAQRERAEARLKDVTRLARNPSDPAVTSAKEKVDALTQKINDLWNDLSDGLRRRVASGPADDSVDREITRVEAELKAMKVQQETLASRLEKLRIENKAASSDVLMLEFGRRDLQRAEEVLDKINANLSQLEYDAKRPTARVELDFEAQPSNRANADKRTQIMAAAPVATALVIVGLLVLMELRGGRVADPEELTSRMNLQVIGVVPPLPQIRSNGPANANAGGGPNGAGLPAASDLRAQRQLDEFVQSLDHLRVALCARRDPWGRDRHCVLITSACGSEGKTTLAAQLAERCVNAGLMTLLIDADLRNPTLSRMLDASENPGLINVLRGDVVAEDVIMVIGDAGGFHLLPAGNPRMDPSRLLQSDRLGKLIAQARESFDMIIVDAPPVLPVPDALTIGRWTDGAVLAVRYDTSRFPLVERASRRLAHVGVSVIGAVVNGVRSMESSYGGYYAYGYSGGYGSVYGDIGSGSGGNGHAHAHAHANGNGNGNGHGKVGSDAPSPLHGEPAIAEPSPPPASSPSGVDG